jgi:hypothetical protein
MHSQDFQTADWYLFVWLIAHGFEVKSIDRTNERKCQFCFEQSAELISAVNEFWKNGIVKVQDFVLAIKKAKVLLHADSF